MEQCNKQAEKSCCKFQVVHTVSGRKS